MFNLDGKPTMVSHLAQTIIDNSGLEFDPEKEDSFAVILYRKDPIDSYLYLTASAGIKEREPLFGPLNWKDYNKRLDSRKHADSDLGFRSREGAFLIDMIDRERWQLYVNGREAAVQSTYETIKERLLSSLESILEASEKSPAPLFPDLWYQERLARDKLRSGTQVLAPGTSLEDFARHLTVVLRDMFVEWLPNASVRIGIYLDTGQSWTLCGLRPLAPWLPDHIDNEPNDGKPNAFNWVRASLSPLLLQPPISKPWEERLQQCGVDISNAISNPEFSGMCIVPIPHNLQPWRCMGIILLTAFDPQILPAHLYLLNRLALGVSGYLMPLLPIPGFLWMPEAKIGRGNAVIVDANQSLQGEGPWKPEREKEEVCEEQLAQSSQGEVPLEVVRKAAKDLLPTNSRIRLSALRAGHSGSVVFRLNVWDAGGITEVPRVLKVGPALVIERELRAYYRYAHNKKVGGASRVDIAREFHLSKTYPPPQQDMYGAIVYTLVGAGDKASPWSMWAKHASLNDIEAGLEMLADQLSCWYDRIKGADATIVDLMIRPLAEGKLQNYLHKKNRKIGILFTQVVNKMAELSNRTSIKKNCRSCVVHGDLHSDNIFAIISGDEKLRGAALIDWGSVQSGWHPLSDISRLMTDLIYRVRPNAWLSARQRRWAFVKVRKWGETLGCGKEDWRIALIHQIAKIMFYRYGLNDFNPYITDEARLQAWDDINELAKDL